MGIYRRGISWDNSSEQVIIMEACRAWTKSWLLTSGRTKFHAIVDEAKLTSRQQEIIKLKFIDDLKNYQIAMRINTSVQTVERDLMQAYNSIYRILGGMTDDKNNSKK